MFYAIIWGLILALIIDYAIELDERWERSSSNSIWWRLVILLMRYIKTVAHARNTAFTTKGSIVGALLLAQALSKIKDLIGRRSYIN